jgi:formate dehydrogenase iron-sulfur subunit
MAEKAILYDTQRCSGCRGCQVSCKEWNENEATKTTFTGSYDNPKELSPKTWIKMRYTEVERGGKLSWLFTRRACMHCTDASCAIVCPTNAILHTEEGFVHIDQEWCIGCGNCVQACPFNIPHKDEEDGRAKKCQACTVVGLNRLEAGQEPACVKSCPPDALIYGDRDDLVAEGRNRVSVLKANGHPNAYLYGDTELGGLHVMYVLDDSPDVYGLPVSPKIASADVISKWLSGLVTAGVVAALPLYFVFRRSQQMAESKAESEGGA